ncbi:LPD29 domain-containing protein [Clostridium sp. 1001283B150210_160208_E6]|uniref:LPD29 domain-containing protein n=1 Tax=Clostridium sp. 1001283B150210_160208_E6 TaxID=2787129 RepID=UPI0018ABDB92|nr:LPD29 domain-containing protein [Clostridium sp. 1001283B150210_160208_E6]
MCKMMLNEKLNGVELYFDGKPSTEVLTDLKANGYRWNGKKICWYAKQNNKTLEIAKTYSNSDIKINSKQIKNNKKEILDIFKLTQSMVSKNDNIGRYDLKAIAKETRTVLRRLFKMVKFSVRINNQSIYCHVVSSPFAEGSEILKSICEYATNYIQQYNECICYDPYGDYGSSYNFYDGRFTVSYDYIQTEESEESKVIEELFLIKLHEAEEIEKIKKEEEYKKLEKQKEIEHQEYLKRVEREKQQETEIVNHVEVKEIKEHDSYYITNCQFANLNKNNTLDEYKEEVNKGDYTYEKVKIERELHFTDEKILSYFENMFLHDFDFLEGTGGSEIDDNSINSMEDYHNMSISEQEQVKWNLLGVAVYLNGVLQFVIDTQGYSYARYVGLVDGVEVGKNLDTKKKLTDEQIEEYTTQAIFIENLSNEVIEENNITNTWNNNDWNIYKKAIKEKLSYYMIKPHKEYIRFISEKNLQLKQAMYKLISECDSIQEQFINANIQPLEKITIFKISEWGLGLSQQKGIYKGYECKDYAQYKDNVNLIFRPFNKRSDCKIALYDKVLICKGWIDINDSVLYDVEKSGNMITKKSKYSMCDNRQLEEVLNILEKNNIKPIINTYKPIFD